MTLKEQQSFEEVLLDRKKQILSNFNDAMKEMKEIRGMELNDEADHASVAADIDRDNAIIKKQKEELNDIEFALGKIERGTYGICEMCEDEINIERLKVKNFARYCISCREINEKESN